jgi:DNA-binding LytR/AlgR family response regulator
LTNQHERSSRVSFTADGRLALRFGRTTDLIAVESIAAARADGNHTVFSSDGGEVRVRACLGWIVEQMRPFGLMAVGRGLAVNAARVRRVAGKGEHRLVVVLDTGMEVPVGRGYQRQVRDWLEFGSPPSTPVSRTRSSSGIERFPSGVGHDGLSDDLARPAGNGARQR